MLGTGTREATSAHAGEALECTSIEARLVDLIEGGKMSSEAITPRGFPRDEDRALMAGVLVGLLVGAGHFGGDGKKPEITLRMHVRHEALFRWLERHFPGGRVYGPYSHAGRNYYQ